MSLIVDEIFTIKRKNKKKCDSSGSFDCVCGIVEIVVIWIGIGKKSLVERKANKVSYLGAKPLIYKDNGKSTTKKIKLSNYDLTLNISFFFIIIIIQVFNLFFS